MGDKFSITPAAITFQKQNGVSILDCVPLAVHSNLKLIKNILDYILSGSPEQFKINENLPVIIRTPDHLIGSQTF